MLDHFKTKHKRELSIFSCEIIICRADIQNQVRIVLTCDLDARFGIVNSLNLKAELMQLIGN